eukprot:1553315-Pleurochrysis_carterae.AAC.1
MSEGSFRRVVMVRWTPCPFSCSAELATSGVETGNLGIVTPKYCEPHSVLRCLPTAGAVTSCRLLL